MMKIRMKMIKDTNWEIQLKKAEKIKKKVVVEINLSLIQNIMKY